ncbi:hypothetical protein [Saccharothrix sp. NRRL B-16348]|uniref:hypothetical protein n=1 Tax=Saccharothrix sp. NRRL B-16348 TaxID=1415542 RepID=UPI0012F8910A|nr:hypothetical protein [Saccharothrix sp. NRRL B-16348]
MPPTATRSTQPTAQRQAPADNPPTSAAPTKTSPGQAKLPVAQLTRPAVQRHLATAPLIPNRRPLVSPATADPPNSTNLPRPVPLRWTSRDSATRRPSGSTGPERATTKAPAHHAPAPPRTTPTQHVQRAVVRPAPVAGPPEPPHQPITRAHPPVTAPTPVQKTNRVTPAIPTVTVQRIPQHTEDRPTPTTRPGSTRPERPDLDELARRLLDPLSRLLRAELRHGRERAGLLHDRRR